MPFIGGTNGADSISGTGSSGGLPTIGSADLFSVSGLDGNDTIVANPVNVSPFFAFGGLGNDRLQSGNGSNSALFGEVGDDTLLAGGGADELLDGGDGNDSITGPTSNVGGTILRGGNGNDTLAATAGFNLIFEAGEGDDSVAGSSGDDRIRGSGGADTVAPGLGFDTVTSGAGDDLVLAGADSLGDLLEGGSGNDTVNAGAGNDAILAGIGNDSASGGAGFDTIDGGSGDNTLFGGGDQDFITGSFGNDLIDGGDGSDWLQAGDGNNTVRGGEGNDVLFAGFGADSMSGGNGNDALTALGGSDTLLGEGGNDNLEGGTGNDSLDGGEGNDGLLGEQGSDTLLGQAGNDLVDGGDGADLLDGGAGNDGLFGGGSADTLEASSGNDRMDGGDGTDVIDYSTLGPNARVVITLAVGYNRAAKIDDVAASIIGGDVLNGVESFIGTARADRFIGWDADDVFMGGAGNDFIDAGSGVDAVRYDSLNSAGAVVNLATGVAQDGLGGTDRLLLSSPGNNFVEDVIGSAVADTIIGDTDNNRIVGRAGADQLNGGAGFDAADYLGDSTVTGVLANLGTVTVGGVAGGRARDSSGAIDTLLGFEALRGTDAADTLIGDDAGNQFRGQGGADVINGNLGNDMADYRNDGDNNGDGFGVIVNLSSATVNVAVFGAEAGLAVAARTARDGQAATDTLISIESARGGGNYDLLVGAGRTLALSFGGIDYHATDRSFLIGRQGNDTLMAQATGDGVVANYIDDQVGIVARLDLGSVIQDGFGYFDTLVNVNGVQGSAHGDIIAASANGGFFRGRGGDDTITAGAGIDALSFGTATSGVVVDLLAGTAQDGEGGTDSLAGNFEVVFGGDFADSMVGDANGTVFFGGAGADTFAGGAGEDWVSYHSASIGLTAPIHAAVLVNLTAQNARDGDGSSALGSLDRFTSIEHAVGSAGDDTIIGTAGANSLAGNDGADTINGSTGNDVLHGNQGADTLEGGAGNDTVLGGAGDDLMFANIRFDVMLEAVGEGADTLIASVAFTLDPTAEIEALVLSGAANLSGTGNAFNNGIFGNAGANLLTGVGGNDTLYGDAGADTLVGGGGGDELAGGDGADLFRFNALAESRGGAALDFVNEFEIGLDHLAFDDTAGRFSAQALTSINLNAVQTIASATNLANVYAQISATAASTAALQVAQVNVLGGAAGGTYLFVADGNATVAANADMLIRLSLSGGTTIGAGDLMLI